MHDTDNISKPSLLILGSQGMLGQELVKVFSLDNYEVTAWDRKDMDLSDEAQIRSKVSDLWPDIIVNASAYNAVDLCEKNDQEYEQAKLLNTKAPGVLADVANDLRAVLVHFSTDYVFDGLRPEYRGEGNAPGCCGSGCRGCSYRSPLENFDGYREHDKPKPLSRYGKTKYEGELAVEKGTDQHYIIRLSRLFGEPASIEGAKQGFFDAMLSRAKERWDIQAVDDEISCFTYAPDLAFATKQILEKKRDFGMYHLTNSGSASWYEATQEFFSLLKSSPEIHSVSGKIFHRPAKRPRYSVLINTKTAPLRNWQEALREYVTSQHLQ
jgi:dTDP-4-dehydrorhamnose reductase